MPSPLLLVSALSSLALAAPAADTDWKTILDQAVPAVVSLRVDAVRAFDTTGASNSVATGFVIDAEQGLLLTNRHVVSPGPVRAEAVFLDNEEVPLEAVYRDPVHDFGVFRFDPESVRFMDLHELELDPTGAKVGADIRIIGNDAGEKISILSGTIARLDRQAPDYGIGLYNDFNTFYLQSASSTSGGSSGSPVIGPDGRVVALNAGSNRKSAASFFLPLDRIVRAVELIRAGEPVTRGTLQATFKQLPFDELDRLGLRDETEAETRARFTEGTGLLVVEQVLPGGPAHGKLQPGDVLTAVNGAPLDAFVPLEAALDDAVGQELVLSVERGGTPIDIAVTVGDLHAISPSHYIEMGGAVLHDLSYQVARSYSLDLNEAGVYVAYRGYAFTNGRVPSGAVITALAGQPTPDSETFASVLAMMPDGARVPVRWYSVTDPNRVQMSIIDIDRRWYSTRLCRRDDASGDWPCETIAAPDGRARPPAVSATLPSAPSRVARKVAPSLVMVDFDIPFRVDGVHGSEFRGTGVILDAEAGLVAVDRDTVPITLGDARMIVGGSVDIPAAVVWVHPTRNVALLRYDPSLLPDTPLTSAVLSPKQLASGDKIVHVGLEPDHSVAVRQTTVSEVESLYLPTPRTPFFREINSRVIVPSRQASAKGGVLVDKKGRVGALWASYVDLSGKYPEAFFRGLPADVLQDALDAYRSDPTAPWPVLGADLGTIELPVARNFGLSTVRAAEIEAADGPRRVVAVGRTTRGAHADEALQAGDLVLELAGQRVSHPWEVEEAAADGPIELTILRRGVEEQVTVQPHTVPTGGTERALLWSGAVLQDVPQWLPSQRGAEARGVYVAWYWYGTPAGRYGLRPTWRIVAVNDVQVANLDEFTAALGDPEASVRLTYIDLKGREKVLTLEPNLKAWPTQDLRRDPTTGAWTRQ